MRLLLTGFEPFGAHPRNPSAEVASACAEALVKKGVDAHYETLPVTYAMASAWAREHLLERAEDTIVLHFGLAQSRAHLSLEARGQNIAGVTPDNDGYAPEHPALSHDHPAEVCSSLDLEALAARVEQIHQEHDLDLPEVRVTCDAGSYVCNAILYHSLLGHPTGRVCFIHVPMQDEETARAQGEAIASALLELTWAKPDHSVRPTS